LEPRGGDGEGSGWPGSALKGNGGIRVSEHLTVVIDDQGIRFTPDGRIAVLDAINALSGRMPAESIWQDFRRDNPDIVCTEYTFPGNETLCVIDRRTMARVEVWLFAYTVERM
jgi:hypothetical protein